MISFYVNNINNKQKITELLQKLSIKNKNFDDYLPEKIDLNYNENTTMDGDEEPQTKK